MFVLELLGADGEALLLHPLGPKPLYLGRSPHNDVVVIEGTVSGRHLSVWCRGSRVFIEDLNSRNGTFVGDRRVQGTQRVAPGDVVRVGSSTRLRLTRSPHATVAGTAPKVLAVEDLAAGVRYPLRADRFRIGSAPEANLVLETGPDVAAVLLVHGNGEVWLGEDDAQRELSEDQPFEVCGRTLILRRLSARVSVTREVESVRYPYALQARLDGLGGPAATLRDLHAGREHTVTGETRAVLLYLLAREYTRDDADLPEMAGWCDDHEVAVGIWGRGDASAHLGKLNVLVCRVRKELREAGFDPWCIEKKRGAIRARVKEARVE